MPADLGELTVDRPLDGATIRVRVPERALWRARLGAWLVAIGGRVAGFDGVEFVHTDGGLPDPDDPAVQAWLAVVAANARRRGFEV